LARDLTHAAIVALAASLTACGAPGQSLPASSSSARIESTLVQAPAARYAITSSAFTGNTPFHHSVGELQAAGATTLPPLLARNYWSEGIQNYLPASQTGGTGPLYTVRAGDPGYRFSCPTYGTCNANGLLVHFPSGAVAQTGIDHHLTSFDPVYIDGETDGWGGDGDIAEPKDLLPWLDASGRA